MQSAINNFYYRDQHKSTQLQQTQSVKHQSFLLTLNMEGANHAYVCLLLLTYENKPLSFSYKALVYFEAN